MYRARVTETPRGSEEDYTFQFGAAHFITLGLLYEQNRRGAGGAYPPILRVDKFLKAASQRVGGARGTCQLGAKGW